MMIVYWIFLLIIVIILVIYTMSTFDFVKPEYDNFAPVSNLVIPNHNVKTYMIKDVRTNLWLNVNDNGLARFYPSGFGYNFRLSESENPEGYLPLRSANNPNNYIISSTDGKGSFRLVTNPGSNILKLQVMNLSGKNILGYTDNNEKNTFIYVDQAGYIYSTNDVTNASVVNMVFTNI